MQRYWSLGRGMSVSILERSVSKAVIVRRVFVSRALFLSELPSDTGFADGAVGEPGGVRGGGWANCAGRLVWEQEVFKLLLADGKISEEVEKNIRSWQHSGPDFHL